MVALAVVVAALAACVVVAVALVLLWTAARKGKLGMNLSETRCPRCAAPLPAIRRPANLRQALWGGSTCASCGCEVDKWGREVPPR